MLSHLFGFILSFYIMMSPFPATLRVFLWCCQQLRLHRVKW